MKLTITLFILITVSFCFAQNTIPEVLEKLNKKTVPYITVEELKQKQNYILLDTREIKEYTIRKRYCSRKFSSILRKR